MLHLKHLLCGKKKFLHTFDVKTVSVPRFKDISIDKVFDKIKDCSAVMEYIPEFDQEKYTAKQMLDRTWFFNIINTIDPNFFPSIIEEIDQQRQQEHRDDNPEAHEINVVQELVDLIEHGIGRSTGRGASAISTLKLGSKTRKAPKQRDPYTYTATIRPDYIQTLSSKNFIKRYYNKESLLVAKRKKLE